MGIFSLNLLLGTGTTITIYLNAFTKDSAKYLTEDVTEKALPSLKILLMDDQEQIRKSSERIFKYLDQKIYIVKNGEDAVETYKKAKKKKIMLLMLL